MLDGALHVFKDDDISLCQIFFFKETDGDLLEREYLSIFVKTR